MSDYDDECDGACGEFVTERNHYFKGKFLTPRDMRAETEYLLSRMRTHNRLLHGWGILCGLNVVEHPTDECRKNYVIIKEGAALDCCGREIYLTKQRYHKLWEDDAERDALGERFLLFVRYHAEKVEPVPALFDDNTGEGIRTQMNRIRDGVCFELRPYEEPWTEFWSDPEERDAPHCVDDCDEQQPSLTGACIKPDCLPAGKGEQMVVLALITRDARTGDLSISMLGRRELPVPSRYLTHVADTNWTHGGKVSLQQLEAWNGELRIAFDRRLWGTDGQPILTPKDGNNGTGVSEFTFVCDAYDPREEYEVEVLSPDDDERYPERPPIRVETREGGCSVAVFRMERHQYTGKRNLAGARVRVTLKCDFILDCHGNAVDGNHLKGRLPSGDGVEGGTFESWFTVVDERDGWTGAKETNEGGSAS